MLTREEAIRGLEYIESVAYGWNLNGRTLGKPTEEIEDICAAAAHLLKKQEPRLLTSKDFFNSPIADAGGAIPCWKEAKSPTRRSGWAVIVYGKMLADKDVACYWTSKPTDAQREATPWPN